MTITANLEIVKLARESIANGDLTNALEVCSIARGSQGAEWELVEHTVLDIHRADPKRFAHLCKEVNPFRESLRFDELIDRIVRQVLFVACEIRADELERAHRLPSGFTKRFMRRD